MTVFKHYMIHAALIFIIIYFIIFIVDIKFTTAEKSVFHYHIMVLQGNFTQIRKFHHISSRMLVIKLCHATMENCVCYLGLYCMLL